MSAAGIVCGAFLLIMLMAGCSRKQPLLPAAQGNASTDSIPAADGVPGIPVLLSPDSAAAGQAPILTLAWKPCAGATSYALQIAVDMGFQTLAYDVSGLSTSQLTCSNLAGNTTYYWRARACNQRGTSPWSAAWFFHTAGGLVNISTSTTPGNCRDMVSNGSRLFINNQRYATAGVYIYNIDDPSRPVAIGFQGTLQDVQSMDVEANYLYVLRVDSTLVVYDVGGAPPYLIHGICSVPHGCARLIVSNGYAYLAGNAGLYVVDVRDPGHPSLAGFCGSLSLWDLAVTGNYAYAAAYGNGIRVIDISVPSAPHEVGSYALPNPYFYPDHIVVSGGYAYVSTFWANRGVRVVDVRNPAAPVQVGRYDFDGSEGLAICGRYVLLAGGSYGVTGLDVADPANPALAWREEMFVGPHADYISMMGNYALVGGYGGWRIAYLAGK